MRTAPFLTCAIPAALLLVTGCSGRQTKAELAELRADNARYAEQISNLTEENVTLAGQRDSAREENVRLREQLDGASSQIRNFSKSVTSLGTSLIVEEGAVILKQDFAFKKGSATLNSGAVSDLNKLAELLNSAEYADTIVTVEGHTDNTPVVRKTTKTLFQNNNGLSAMRAASVKTALEAAGVSNKRIRGAFRGESAPRKENSTAEGKAANRRVAIYLHLPQSEM